MSDATTLVEGAAPADGAVLDVLDVAVHFGGIKAVDGVTMRLRPGAISGIIGPNGSGKSTLIAAITRMVPLTRGSLVFLGRPYDRIAPDRIAGLGMSRTFQTVRLVPSLTVLENVQLGADLGRRRSDRTRDELVDDAVERVGIATVVKLRPSELPYGVQRRVEIARALAMSPRLLLLDEPTAGMNRSERREIAGLLRDLRGGGVTQLLVEHDVATMVETCDHLYGMNLGRLIAEGTPAEVVRNPLVQEAYLGREYSRDA